MFQKVIEMVEVDIQDFGFQRVHRNVNKYNLFEIGIRIRNRGVP